MSARAPGPARRRGALAEAGRAGLRSLLALVALGLAGLALLGAALLDLAPRVAPNPEPDAAAAAQAQALFRRLVHAGRAGPEEVALSEDEINGALSSLARVAPGLAGRARVEAGRLAVAGSYPVAAGLWLNVGAAVAASEDGVRIAALRVGRVALPPPLAETALRIGLDLALGSGAGSAAFGAVDWVRIDPPRVAVGTGMSEADRRLIRDGLRGALTPRSRAGDGARADALVAAFADAEARGALAPAGSFLAYLRFALAAAHDRAEGAAPQEAEAEARAALYALAILCGDARFAAAVGAEDPPDGAGCGAARLGGRPDLRRHFALSAGIQAATSGLAATGAGELKELLDSNPGGSGFSFDDMAANLAGARFAEAFAERPPADWPLLAAAIREEAAVLPAFGDLPSGLTEAEFRAGFGSVESDAYHAMVGEIRRRVDALALYRRPGG